MVIMLEFIIQLPSIFHSVSKSDIKCTYSRGSFKLKHQNHIYFRIFSADTQHPISPKSEQFCAQWTQTDGHILHSIMHSITYCVHINTYSMEQSPSWGAKWFSASQEIPCILWNPKVQYHIHKCPPPAPILSQARGFLCKWFVTGYFFTVRSC
jgi:hypothetical protein